MGHQILHVGHQGAAGDTQRLWPSQEGSGSAVCIKPPPVLGVSSSSIFPGIKTFPGMGWL